jgi:hypothetical protein
LNWSSPENDARGAVGFLIAVGPGRRSLDAWLQRRLRRRDLAFRQVAA